MGTRMLTVAECPYALAHDDTVLDVVGRYPVTVRAVSHSYSATEGRCRTLRNAYGRAISEGNQTLASVFARVEYRIYTTAFAGKGR